MDLLKLVALDAEDLAIISTHLQDAVLKVGDIVFLPRERRFAIEMRRFDWEAGFDQPPQRRLTCMHFEQVKAVRVRGVDQTDKSAVLNLLGMSFDQSNAPAGTVTLMFAEGGVIQVDVECVELQMADVGPIWAADGRPVHGETGTERR